MNSKKMQKDKPVYVTMPSLAPLEEFTEILKGVWKRGILTHNGPLVQKLEADLEDRLRIKHFSLVSNGTIAIQIAIKALEVKGEIITTPFTWVATLSAIKWENCTPVFADIDPETLNISISDIEAKITKNTVAIMPVHVFGNPCDVEGIQKIARKHGLKVIYDAAHAIGSTFKGKSLLEYGDISATSLHATKLFNTAEGGGCITNDSLLFEKIKRIRFFGYNNNKDIIEDGFNGKMTEVHAALGLANLKYYDEVLTDRKEKYNYYLNQLSNNKDLRFQKIKYGKINYSYFPIILKDEKKLINIIKKLNSKNIFPRRYFYPSVNFLSNIVKYDHCPHSERISKKILCLPLFKELDKKSMKEISKLINDD